MLECCLFYSTYRPIYESLFSLSSPFPLPSLFMCEQCAIKWLLLCRVLCSQTLDQCRVFSSLLCHCGHFYLRPSFILANAVNETKTYCSLQTTHTVESQLSEWVSWPNTWNPTVACANTKIHKHASYFIFCNIYLVIRTFHISEHHLVPTCSDNWLPTVYIALVFT